MTPDWWVVEPGASVPCPVCSAFLAVFGSGIRVWVRRHPKGRRGQRVPAPTHQNGESRICDKCRNPLDLRLEIIGETARVA